MAQVYRSAPSDASDDEMAAEIRGFFRFFWHEWLASPARRAALEEASGLPRSAQVILQRLHRDGPMTSSELARGLMLDRSTISRQLRPLEESGLLDPATTGGGRRALLRLTPEGTALAQQVDELVMTDYSEAINRLPRPRRAALADLLAELRQAMEDTVAEEVAGASDRAAGQSG